MFGTYKPTKAEELFKEEISIEVYELPTELKNRTKIQLNSKALDTMVLRNHPDNLNPVLTRWITATEGNNLDTMRFCKHPGFIGKDGIVINKSGGGSSKVYIEAIRKDIETELPNLVNTKFFISLQPSKELDFSKPENKIAKGIVLYEIKAIYLDEDTPVWERSVEVGSTVTFEEIEETTENIMVVTPQN